MCGKFWPMLISKIFFWKRNSFTLSLSLSLSLSLTHTHTHTPDFSFISLLDTALMNQSDFFFNKINENIFSVCFFPKQPKKGSNAQTFLLITGIVSALTAIGVGSYLFLMQVRNKGDKLFEKPLFQSMQAGHTHTHTHTHTTHLPTHSQTHT